MQSPLESTMSYNAVPPTAAGRDSTRVAVVLAEKIRECSLRERERRGIRAMTQV
jgi:hypothetical protein